MGKSIDEGDYVREYWQVPAHLGARVTWRGHPGTITAFDLAYLRIRLDADPLDVDATPEEVVAHPTWEIIYTAPGTAPPPETATSPARHRRNLYAVTDPPPGATATPPDDGDGTGPPDGDAAPYAEPGRITAA